MKMKLLKGITGVVNVKELHLVGCEDVPGYLRQVQEFVFENICEQLLKSHGISAMHDQVTMVTRDMFDDEGTIEVRGTWGPVVASPLEMFGGIVDGFLADGGLVEWDENGIPNKDLKVADAAERLHDYEIAGIRMSNGTPRWVYMPKKP